ncbi:DUF4258 domain-containing protein [Jiella sonneratiae]|uniref:DUF4258 domain-containing protein n=1 Tax=Jiella sonneratiae TaxID=2816856 RepID=A0ABS3J524_9HYPH|nr:DUF4258 domain-containing protein [Jiella sonneratiae]MBO0904768.1 DUF4258 domain-containing protein [Jiella sonneratiae]
MEIDWSDEKDIVLKGRYGFGFERVVMALANGDLIEERRHPNVDRYPHQRQYVVSIDGYIWLVPFVRQTSGVFLKTMYPSRKATKHFLKEKT